MDPIFVLRVKDVADWIKTEETIAQRRWTYCGPLRLQREESPWFVHHPRRRYKGRCGRICSKSNRSVETWPRTYPSMPYAEDLEILCWGPPAMQCSTTCAAAATESRLSSQGSRGRWKRIGVEESLWRPHHCLRCNSLAGPFLYTKETHIKSLLENVLGHVHLPSEIFAMFCMSRPPGDVDFVNGKRSQTSHWTVSIAIAEDFISRINDFSFLEKKVLV